MLHLLKKYVLIFQIREPLIHMLRDEQLLLMKDFMGCFVKPELLLDVSGKKICKIDLEADASLLKKKDMFIGPQAQHLLKECRRSNSKATGFLDQVKEACNRYVPSEDASQQHTAETPVSIGPCCQRP